MRAAHEKYRDQGFEVLSVSIQESDAVVDDFIAKYDLGYRFVMDRTGRTASEYEIASTPTTFFVRPDGTIVDSIAGVVSSAWLERNLDPFVTT